MFRQAGTVCDDEEFMMVGSTNHPVDHDLKYEWDDNEADLNGFDEEDEVDEDEWDCDEVDDDDDENEEIDFMNGLDPELLDMIQRLSCANKETETVPLSTFLNECIHVVQQCKDLLVNSKYEDIPATASSQPKTAIENQISQQDQSSSVAALFGMFAPNPPTTDSNSTIHPSDLNQTSQIPTMSSFELSNTNGQPMSIPFDPNQPYDPSACMGFMMPNVDNHFYFPGFNMMPPPFNPFNTVTNFNPFFQNPIDDASNSTHSEMMMMSQFGLQQPCFDESLVLQDVMANQFSAENIEAELLKIGATETNRKTSTLHLQKINELAIIKNNTCTLLESTIRKLNRERTSLPIVMNQLGSSFSTNQASTTDRLSLFPEAIAHDVQFNSDSKQEKCIISFDESVQVINFIASIMKMHNGSFPTKFIDTTRSFGTYLMGILTFAQSTSRSGFDVTIFESNKQEYEMTKHNVDLFTNFIMKRNIFSVNTFRTSVENMDFFDWLFDSRNNIYSTIVMMDLTVSNREYDPSFILTDLKLGNSTVKKSANEIIEHLLYFGASCVVVKTPANYSEKNLSTHNKLWRIYVKVIKQTKYVLVFNNKPSLMVNNSRHKYGEGRRK